MINQTQLLLLLKVTILAFILGSISLPIILELVSPFWLLMFFIYWLIYSDSNGIFSAALILGLLLDVLQGAILGQNALALIVSSAFILSVKKSFFVSNLDNPAGLCIYCFTHLSRIIFNDASSRSRSSNPMAHLICTIYRRLDVASCSLFVGKTKAIIEFFLWIKLGI